MSAGSASGLRAPARGDSARPTALAQRRARDRRRRALRRRRRQRVLWLVALVVLVALAAVLRPAGGHPRGARSHPGSQVAATLRRDVEEAAAISPLRGRIVAIAEGQLGYSTDPANTYCNRFSAYWISGTDDCGNSNLDEEWCADFAAWVWQKAGATVVYQYINGDLNSSSASFYEWGAARGTWHPVGTGYVPLPGDVAVYGLNVPALVAQHVAVVISFTEAARGPDAVNGDGDHAGFSVVELGRNEFQADVRGKRPAPLSGYVSPD